MEKLNTLAALLAKVDEATRADGLAAEWRYDEFGRGSARLTWEGQHTVGVPLVVHPGLTARTSGPVLVTAETGALIVTERVTEELARQLRRNGFAYLDAAGNAYIRQPGLLVDVQGRRPAQLPRPTPLLTKAAVPVVMCVLNQPALLDAPLRALVERTPASLGTVQGVMKGLRHRLERTSSDSFQARLRQLALEWSSFYLEVYRPALGAERYSSALDPQALREGLESVPAVVSGEAAAASMGCDLVPGTCDLYADPSSVAETRRRLRLRRDPDGDITMRDLFWNQDVVSEDRGAPGSRLAPPVLVWSDLSTVEDPRVRDAARALAERL